jgi:hypothetical protein
LLAGDKIFLLFGYQAVTKVEKRQGMAGFTALKNSSRHGKSNETLVMALRF